MAVTCCNQPDMTGWLLVAKNNAWCTSLAITIKVVRFTIKPHQSREVSEKIERNKAGIVFRNTAEMILSSLDPKRSVGTALFSQQTVTVRLDGAIEKPWIKRHDSRNDHPQLNVAVI